MVKRKTIFDCSIKEISKVESRSGNISVIEAFKTLPFKPKRLFYIYDIPSGESRGAHAHIDCHQFLVAVSGSFEVLIDDGFNKMYYTLNRPFYGIHIHPGIWANEQNFSGGAICLVLTSHNYNENDYIRDYSLYLEYIKTIEDE